MSDFEPLYNDLSPKLVIPTIVGGLYAAYKTRNYKTSYYDSDKGSLFDRTMMSLIGASIGGVCGIIGIPAICAVSAVIVLEELEFKNNSVSLK